ncbi:MAG TPA: DUF6364 family protein [Dinghuibacter sp.]|jgi:hypothetical protein|uniref:DUF6364 family protein n=1 Tax=Dinghuibacter sp. TaxID=2024697 RepID=UPI002CE3FB58|nr:DUF6364 family protein [Dinghuibacter sp.]HTJ12534.1 DUF6364 family protein [Dinghuibacter sp.]
MTTKLTLALDAAVIEKAKRYAQRKNTSLSGMVENFLAKVVEEEPGRPEAISPLVKKLSGVLTLSPDADHKSLYGDHLSDKYGK